MLFSLDTTVSETAGRNLSSPQLLHHLPLPLTLTLLRFLVVDGVAVVLVQEVPRLVHGRVRAQGLVSRGGVHLKIFD